MVAHSVSSSRAVATVCPSVAVVQQEELMAEIESITEQLTKTRNTLWETQDNLRTTEQKAQQLEMHVAELVAERKNDARQVKQLQEDNARYLEDESKIRESLELMKKVFIRGQLKAKEDQENIALLQEERDLLLLENETLRKNAEKMMAKEQKSNKMARRHEMENLAMDRDASDMAETTGKSKGVTKDVSPKREKTENKPDSTSDSRKNERLLSDALERTRFELKEYKKKHLHADHKIRRLKNELLEVRESNHHYDEPGLLDRLGLNIFHLIRGNEDRDSADNDIVNRAFFDEDLEESLTRSFIQNLSCDTIGPGLNTKNNDVAYDNNIDCESFDDDVASNSYSFAGLGQRPQSSHE